MTIEQYLRDGGSFREGLALYEPHADPVIWQRLQKAAGLPYVLPSAKKLLIDELTKLSTSKDPITTPAVRKGGEHTGGAPAVRAPLVADEPEAVTQLRQRGRMLKKRESFLHAQLVLISQEKSSLKRKRRLHEIAVEIMEEIEPALDEVYGAIRDWEQAGIAPVDNKGRIVEETVAKMKQYDSLRTRIYQLRGYLDGKKALTSEERAKYEKSLLKKELELKKLQQELGLD